MISQTTYLQLSLSRLTCYQTFNVCLLWKIESKSPLHEYRAISLTLLTGKITNSHPSAEEKSYINVTEAKEKHVARCRSTCEAEFKRSRQIFPQNRKRKTKD